MFHLACIKIAKVEGKTLANFNSMACQQIHPSNGMKISKHVTTIHIFLYLSFHFRNPYLPTSLVLIIHNSSGVSVVQYTVITYSVPKHPADVNFHPLHAHTFVFFSICLFNFGKRNEQTISHEKRRAPNMTPTKLK